MRFEADPDSALWLEAFKAASEDFDWDEGNREKNLKHGVTAEEIESVFRREVYVFAGRIADPAHQEWRGLVLGQSARGRRLALIFTRRDERLRPISCRPMRKNERRFYEAIVTAKKQ